MKKNFFLLLVITAFSANGQTKGNFDLNLSTGTVTLPANYAEVRDLKPSSTEVFNGTYYRYVQFVEFPSSEQKRELCDKGLRILMYVPDNTYIAAIKKGTNLASLSGPALRSVHVIKPQYKMLNELHEAVEANNFPGHALKGNKVGVIITYYADITHEPIKAYLKKKGYEIIEEDASARTFVVYVRTSKVRDFVALPFVSSAELMDEEPKHDNSVGRTDIRSNAISTDYSGGRKYNGAGVHIALQDDGVIGPHIDYQGRIPNQFTLSNWGDHGDHCGGTIMGAGNKDPMMRGMAWGSNVYVYSASGYQAFAQISTHYNTYGIRVISTSYSDGCNAGYTTRAQQLDMQNLAMPELIHVFSAGNDGASNCNYGAGAGWGNVTGGHKHSKNSIAVANLSYIDVRANSSSRGPAHDGRLKPEVSAVGTNVWSTRDTNRYQSMTGTSMSCPAVAGLFAQLYQAYKNLNSNTTPPSALIKAVVMNTADDLGNPGPDFGYGYGRVNGLNAAKVLEQGAYLTATVSNAGTNTHTLVIPANARRVKIMTYWHDYQANVGAAVALVNNLNTTITDPNSTVHNPLILNYSPNATSLNTNAAPGVDIRNNHEQITLNNPVAGNYVLTVSGTSVPMGPQAYYVTWQIETDGYTLTYPMGGEGFVPGVSETIRWDAFETTGNQTLQYTTNNGSTWTNISTTINGLQRYYNWTPPSTISGQCRIRISRGLYSAESDTNFSIIPTPANLQVAWACPDSVKLTWNTVAGATSYDVFKLGSTYMDSVGTSLTNSIVLTNIPIGQTHWFSVRSRGALNAVGRRAIAVEKQPGVKACPQLADDLSCSKVLSPSGTIGDCHDLSQMPVIVDIYNPGMNTLAGISVHYRINGGPIVSESFQGAVTPSTTATFTFATNATMSSAGVYNIKAWVSNSADINRHNDTAFAKLTVAPGVIKALPVVEDFETFTLCSTNNYCPTNCPLFNGFINESNTLYDQHDWRTHSGPPPTANTGPQMDFMPGIPTGQYVYLESSAPCESLTASMLSPCVDLSTSPNPGLSFAYHMYGATTGTLHLDVFSRGSWNNSVWSASGDQGNYWKTVSLGLSSWGTDTVTFRWRGITGGSLSDIALDAINVGMHNPVGQMELEQLRQFKVFPNPSTSEFNIVIPSGMRSNAVYSITDITGRVVISGKADARSAGKTEKIDMHKFAAGIYTLRITYNDHVEYTKLHKI